MADFLDIGGVKFPTAVDDWEEQEIDVGDVAKDEGGLSLSGRPIEASAALVRMWHGSLTRSLLTQQGITGDPYSNNGAKFERAKRWIRGWGQCFPCTGLSSGVPRAGSGLTLGPAANVTMANSGGPYGTGKATVSSSASIGFTHTYAMRQRRGFSPTGAMGFTIGFLRNFLAAEALAAGQHWIVATGAATFAQGSGNPAGITQYVDGAAANASLGNYAAVSATQMLLYGKKSDGVTNSAVEYADVFMLPYQLPASWIASIWTNLINAGTKRPFPVLPRQKLSGQWLTFESAPVEAIGHVDKTQRRVGMAGGVFANDLREIPLAFVEW
jgi:hypothetical protein